MRLPGGQLEAALVQYKRSLDYNIGRAEQNIRNVRAILVVNFPENRISDMTSSRN